MPNALASSLAILDDIDGGFPMQNIDWSWMYTRPLVALWADAIYAPRIFTTGSERFEVDVGFGPSNETLTESISYAWNALVKEGIIRPIPVDSGMREAMRFAEYSVRNRLQQTKDNNLVKLSISAKAISPNDNGKMVLALDDQRYCMNHLDSVAAHLIVAKATNSVWLADERDDAATHWLFSGGFDNATSVLHARNTIARHLPDLRLPKFEFIPQVANCSNCGNSGTTCFSSYGPKGWISGAQRRLYQILELRGSPEVKALRSLMNELSATLAANIERRDWDLSSIAKESIWQAASNAEKRMRQADNDLKTLTELSSTLCGPLAIFALTTESSLLGKISAVSASAIATLSSGARLLLTNRHRWLQLRERDIS